MSATPTPNHIQIYRKIVQYLFLGIIVLIGVQCTLFVNQLEKGILPTITRPPGIEGFLPISSLISFKSVSYTHLTLPTTRQRCISRWWPEH